MLVRQLTLGLLGFAAILMGMQTSHAQKYLPVADPFAFEPDFRWFEPIYNADLQDMRPDKRASKGWFGTFDRMNLFVTRPENVPSSHKLDGGWGNRIDFGFMLDEDNGWMASYLSLTGPAAARTVRTNRLNLVAEPTVTTDTRGEPVPVDRRNTPGFSERLYFPGRTLNSVDIDGFELNKTFRLEPYHYGGILEPIIGFRYLNITDRFMNSIYTSDIPTRTEIFTSSSSIADNQMFGGQIGFRYYKFHERFTLSTDLRVFALQNFQSAEDQTFTETTSYELNVPIRAAPVDTVTRTVTPDATVRNDEFVFGFDLRGEVAYQLTRDFSVRGGVQIYDVAQGVWRGQAVAGANDQAMFLVGYTFGVQLNR